MTSIDTPSRGRGLGMGLAVVLAWLLGLAITLPAEWDRVRTGLSEQQGLAAWFADIIIDSTPYFLVLAVSPLLVLVVWLVSDGKRSGRRQVGWRRWLAAGPGDGGRGALAVAVFVGGLSILASAHVASRHPPAAPTVCFGELPPAYHDEYSYLFQARTLIDGRLSYPSHPRLPRLFDQMHVLNEGRFASRYFPGVGAWIAPFLAIGHPSQGHWLAGAIAAMAIFGAGRELAGNGTGLLAGVLAATSPGMAVFSNLLLSHHPTLAGLSVFLYLFLVMQRNGCAGCAAASGVGLALAMLCRPLTAAAVALPFGIWLAVAFVRGRIPTRLVASIAAPLAVGLAVMGVYNHAVTGSASRTPYQVYTDIHTPRHVFGFDNARRGETRIEAMSAADRSRVLKNYDDWAQNLEPSLAAGSLLRHNLQARVWESWKWTVGIIPLVVVSVLLAFGGPPGGDRRWWLVVASILMLHAVHIPYWYDGIQGWHYVFESGTLWCLLTAAVTSRLFEHVHGSRWQGVLLAWFALLAVAPVVNFTSMQPFWPQSRVAAAVEEISYSRLLYAEFRRQAAIRSATGRMLVLVVSDPGQPHLDYVVNDPALDGDVLVARHGAGGTKTAEIRETFPDRAMYLFDARSGRWSQRLPPLDSNAIRR